MVVPQHGTALGTETSLGSTHLSGLVFLVESERGDVNPVRSGTAQITRGPT